MSKVVLVTGGNRGIGFGISKAFYEAGYRVVINYRSNHESAKQAFNTLGADPKRVCLIQADISLSSDRSMLVAKTQEHFGQVDVLINNAAISARRGFLKGSEEEYDKIMDCNLKGPYFLAQLIAKEMIAHKQMGSIINITSNAAYDPASGCYSVAKAGLKMATEVMARKLGEHGIRVNSISPGCIQTDMSERGWAEGKLHEAVASQIPLKRGGQPNEIASAALFLASDGASYISGAHLAVDGGYLLKGIL